MKLQELFESKFIYESEEPIITEGTVAWGRKGNKIIRKYRCSFGRRKGRLVSNLAQCGAPIDLKKRISIKKTKAAKGARMTRKAKRTKKFNPTSKRIAKLNKAMRKR